jgi:hypothetical protein
MIVCSIAIAFEVLLNKNKKVLHHNYAALEHVKLNVHLALGVIILPKM